MQIKIFPVALLALSIIAGAAPQSGLHPLTPEQRIVSDRTLEWLAAVNPLLPVIIITGRSYQRALAETAGADTLMEKPLDVPLLLQTIRELMDEPMESRAQRARNRASGSRYMPSDNQPFDEMLLECCMTPSPLPESKDT